MHLWSWQLGQMTLRVWPWPDSYWVQFWDGFFWIFRSNLGWPRQHVIIPWFSNWYWVANRFTTLPRLKPVRRTCLPCPFFRARHLWLLWQKQESLAWNLRVSDSGLQSLCQEFSHAQLSKSSIAGSTDTTHFVSQESSSRCHLMLLPPAHFSLLSPDAHHRMTSVPRQTTRGPARAHLSWKHQRASDFQRQYRVP